MGRHEADSSTRSARSPAAAQTGRRAVLPETPLSVRGTRRTRADENGTEARPAAKEASSSRSPARAKTPRTLSGKLKWPQRSRPAVRPLEPADVPPRPAERPAAEPKRMPTEPQRPPAPAQTAEMKQSSAAHTEPGAAKQAKPVSAPVKSRRGLPLPLRRTRPDEPARPKVPLRVRAVHFVLCLIILAAAAWFYRIWERQTRHEALPPMFMPQPYYYEEEQPVHALLLWREKVITSPVAGTVQLAAGQKAWTVAANDVVATVLSRGRGTAVRVPSRGYFLPALDGAEDTWEYSSLWLGSGLLPKPPELNWVHDLSPLDQSRAVGRLIALPQDPRAIFYLNLTDTLRAALERGTLTIRRESRGPKWTARVRVFVKYSEQRAKVCLDMPYFPIDMVQSREADFLVCSDEDSGLLVPDSAVTIRSGTYGVFELVGDQLVFRSITGKPVRDGMFFVSSGLSPGNPVIVNAANAEEKRVRLW